jgi:two-component system NtrC family sensor kinase
MIGSESHVLIVDDRDANRYTVAHILTRAGFRVKEATTGRQALELAQEHPSVILLDVKLPDILGYEVCRRIKTNPNTSSIPVLQLSAAFLDNESKIYALESGADAYLTQPVEPNVLIATVKALVRLNEAEAQSRLSARQWQATFDALNEGVALIDSQGVIQRANRALGLLLAKPYVQLENFRLIESLRTLFSLEIDPEKKLDPVEVSANGGYFELRLDPIFLDGRHTSSIVILNDITTRKRAEAAILSNERLAATGRMANTIAHEINNPLEAVTNLLYLLDSSLDQPVGKEYLGSAQKELERVSRIARQILSFNRETNRPVSVNLSETLADVLSLNNQAILEKKLEIVRDWDMAATVKGSPSQLRQVFLNLVRNAIEASTQNSSIRIRISERAGVRDAEQRFGRVVISDRGVGIPAQNLVRVFDAFFTTKELKGSGIGLWLSNTIVEEHHGKIKIRSTTAPGRSGTCVSVRLPCN